MTLASKLLEGYCPEGYCPEGHEPIEEGLTPDEVMVRTNAICTECISCLYEAAELFCTEDIVASTEVLTEGAGVVDKIKELADKFVKRMKAIWDWFVKKVKAFPGWIRGLFRKNAEQVEKIAEKATGKPTGTPAGNASIGGKFTTTVNVPAEGKIKTVKLSILDKHIKDAQRMTKQIETLIGSSFVNDVTAEMDKALDPKHFIEAYDEFKGKEGSTFDSVMKERHTEMEEGKEEILNGFGVESFGEITSGYTDIVNELDKVSKSDSSREVVDRSKFNSYLSNIRKLLKDAENGSVKSIEASIKKFEKILSTMQSDQFKSTLIKAFTDTKGKHNGTNESYLRSIASSYVSTMSKGSSEIVNIMNIVMGGQTGLIKVYSKIVDVLSGFALTDAAQRRLVAEDNGDDD